MKHSIFKIERPGNEPILSYAPGSQERADLKKALAGLRSQEIEVPLIIGGKEIRTGNMADMRVPHDHKHLLGRYHKASSKEVELAITAALEAQKSWAAMGWEDRLAIFQKAAELLAGPYRMILNAATMLGQSKNAYQAEIDSACELIDFYRWNPYFATQIYQNQPISPTGQWNQTEFRPLEGFIFAVTPFNFTSIAGNLPTSPAMLGNVSLWKPASSSVYSGYFIMKLLKEAGVPDGVINFVPGPGGQVGDPAVMSPHFAGIHFTGSTQVFQDIWRLVGKCIPTYKSYPRIVGETGGKDFIFVHPSADYEAVAVALLRGAFEYQGQKCSAASRAYIPKSLWPKIKERLIADLETIKTGVAEDFSNFINAVIDKSAFKSITGYIDLAKNSPDAEIIAGGTYSDAEGYFIKPTVILAKKPDFKTMVDEIFGPVLTLFVYEDSKLEEALSLCDTTSAYALTGAVFAQDRYAIVHAKEKLSNAAGNFYINDKPTGAVVGQQPFGGARASGTNDKAGSMWNLSRWLSVRTIKENFVPPKDYRYPFLKES